jgi:SAM-dependent methyltransferase
MVLRWLRPLSGSHLGRDFGVEIGAFQTPIPDIRPFYVDRFVEFTKARVRCLADYQGDATALPFRSHSLDYVASSHVLEHVANPVAALFEWARVVRHGGILYLVVPDRRYTFDHRRELTPPEHMMEDFVRGTTYCDGTHLNDYLDRIDLALWNPGSTPEENLAERERLRAAYLAALAAGEQINIHFHVFEPSNLEALIAAMNRHPQSPAQLEIVDRAERFPSHCANGFLLVLRVAKPLPARIKGALFRLRARGDSRAALRPDAKSFEA